MDLISTVIVLGFFLALSDKLDDLIDKRPIFKNEMVSTIINFPTEKYPDIIKKSNRIFLQLFNIIYESKSKKRDHFIWIWLFMSFSTCFLFGFVIYLLKISVYLENFLICILIYSSASVISVGLTLYVFPKLNINKKLVIILLMGAFMGFFVFYPIKLIGIDLKDGNSVNIMIIFLLIFTPIFGFAFFNFLSKRSTAYLNISPPRVIISSILVITIIALLKKDIAQYFIFDFNQIGMILLAYLLLNIFADSISLWETNIILRYSARGRIKNFFLLGLLDLFLSTAIFLAIPLSMGKLDIFFDSIWFKGENPWLGILFWSTFSTSILFWAFLLAIFGQIVAQKMLAHYVNLNKILPIEEKPFTCLYFFAIVIIMPFVFLIF